MNVSLYIARKIRKARNTKGSIIGPVINAATLAITLGLILMLLSVATGIGLKRAIGNKIVGFNGHITVTRYDLNNSYEQQAISMDSVTANDIGKLPDIQNVQPFGTKAGILTGDNDFEGVVLKGVNSHYNWRFFSESLRAGTIPNFTDSTRNDSILISTVLADRLNLGLHDKVNMYFIQEPPRPPKIRKFYIAGLYSTGLEEFDKSFLIGHLTHVQRLNGWRNDEAGGYEVVLENGNNLIEATTNLRALLPYDLDARSVRNQNEQLFQWLDLFDLNIYLIVSIMLAVAVINMISALLILILDRTKMIGLFKALGMPNGKLMQIFIYQSVGIILKGMVWGNAIGIGLCIIQQQFGIIKLDPETYYVNQAPVYLDWPLILMLNLVVLIICTAALLIPALLVSRISPVRALRYE